MKNCRDGRSVAYYMRLPYTYEITPDTSGAGFVAVVKEIPGCMSQGNTAGHATSRLRELMELWFSVCLEDGTEIPEPVINLRASPRR